MLKTRILLGLFLIVGVFSACKKELSPEKQAAKDDELIVDFIAKNNIPALLAHSGIYFLHGRVIFKQLSWMDRFMLKMGASLEKDPITKKENIAEIVNAVKILRPAKRETIHSRIL